ncbi:XRE family transcriptional regulator [Comamonas testosteroni]|uniref:XRE family transcriptional regulator n=2 Tax=Comamonas testosteroni TaxID=285 RepID=A0A096H1N2_COMTE|nr:XRE family transcriptional regulator [Comamonas testosteroni]
MGARLRDERLRLELSQLAMAEACAVSRNTQSAWEKGDQTPNGAAFLAMTELGVDVLFVITGAKTNESESTLAPVERELLKAWRNGTPEGRAALEAVAKLAFLSPSN